MGDFLKDIDKLCGTQNNWIALPLTGSVIAGMEMILTIPLNAVIVYCLIKERKQKYKSLFYKLVLNIAICDLLTGLIADPIAIETFIKEAIKMKVALVEVYLIHLSLFITDAVALLTLSILSVERIVAIMLPVKHHKGVKRSIENGLIISAWILGSALVSPYFQLGFIRQLFVFSTFNIVVTVLSLVVTALTYNYKMKTKISTHSTATSSQSTDHLSVQFNGQRPESDADMANLNDTTSSTLNIRVISVQFNDQQQSALAAEAPFTVAQLVGLVDPRARPGRHRGPPECSGEQLALDFDGGVASGVDNLPTVQMDDLAHASGSYPYYWARPRPSTDRHRFAPPSRVATDTLSGFRPSAGPLRDEIRLHAPQSADAGQRRLRSARDLEGDRRAGLPGQLRPQARDRLLAGVPRDGV